MTRSTWSVVALFGLALGCSSKKTGGGDFPVVVETSAVRLELDASGRVRFHGPHGASLIAGDGTAALVSLAQPGDDAAKPVAFASAREEPVMDPALGAGRRTIALGTGAGGLAKITATLTAYDAFPEGIVVDAEVAGVPTVSVAELRVLSMSLAGRTPENTRVLYGPAADTVYMEDYLAIPPVEGYRKSGDMLAGGEPINVVWGPGGGLALAVVEPEPTHVALPLAVAGGVISLAVTVRPDATLGEATSATAAAPLRSPRVLLMGHEGDYYAPLRTLAEVVGRLGGVPILHDAPPEAAYGPLWKTWGLDPVNSCWTRADIESRFADLSDLGFRTILLDYGWFESEGDWSPSTDPPERFTDEASLVTFVSALHDAGFLVGLWYQPVQLSPDAERNDLAVGDASCEPLVDDDGLYNLNPALAAARQLVLQTVKKFVAWGVDYLYIDSQEAQLAARPDRCHQMPGGPLDSFRALPGLYKLVRESAPAAVIESCPDGRDHTLYNMPYYDVNNVGDPASDLQARWEVKELKALRGDRSAVGIYVDRLCGSITFGNDATACTNPPAGADTDECDNPLSGDFRTVIGVGATLMSMYSSLDVAGRENWRVVADHIRALHPERGAYRNLYDVGFDRPEAHAVALEGGRMQYGFFQRVDPVAVTMSGQGEPQAVLTPEPATFNGALELRGLEVGKAYRVSRWPEGDVVGSGSADSAGKLTVSVSFDRALVLLAEPM